MTMPPPDPEPDESLDHEMQRYGESLQRAVRELTRCQRDNERLQALLHASATDFRATFELAAVGIAHLTPDGRWLRINQCLCKMLGYSREELETMTFQQLTHPDDLDADLALVRQVLDGTITAYTLEKRYLRKDGTLLWGNLSVSLLRDDAGAPKYFISVIKDIGDHVRALEDLQRSRARLAAVLESLREGVIVFGADGTLLEMNSSAQRMFEYESMAQVSSRPEHLDRRVEVATLDGTRLPVAEWPISRLLAGQSVPSVELKVSYKRSGRSWIGAFAGTIVRTGPAGTQLAVLTTRDISQRKCAEKAMQLSEERLRLAFDNIPDAVILYDTKLAIQAINATAAEMAGQAAEELVGKRDADLPPFSPLALWSHLLQDALMSAVTQSDDLAYPGEHGMRYLEVTCVPLLEQAGAVREVMVIANDYTERRRAEERARHAALHDPLTGLPNRALLFEYAHHVFARAQRRQQQVAVAFIDLDRFKPINDLYGHDVGDTVLHQVANRIQANIRGEDMVFRLGGDEFLALLPGLADSSDAEALARQLNTAIAAPYQVGGLELTLSASIGISLYPYHAEDVDTLISHADAAMYQAKQMGRDHAQVYSPELANKLHGQLRIEHQIKRALAQQHFCLYYQPLVNVRTNELVSVEALLRLQGNPLSPDRFVPVAEATGLISPLSEWVFAEACRQHSHWKREGLPSIPIAVNVSALQFRNKNFQHFLNEVIDRQRLGSDAIQIELTETAVMEDIEHAVAVLSDFRSRGIKVSLDDFGTGYSSLSHLSRLPLDKIKVDKSFIHRMHNDLASRTVTDSIIALGRALNLEIVAEGIETEQELDYLRNQGCDQAQGFYLCKPLPGTDFIAWYRGGMPLQAPPHPS
jgi:diguanylate cyclase (GGDEF)-like protein/PAS domain S-box-containing protein